MWKVFSVWEGELKGLRSTESFPTGVGVLLLSLQMISIFQNFSYPLVIFNHCLFWFSSCCKNMQAFISFMYILHYLQSSDMALTPQSCIHYTERKKKRVRKATGMGMPLEFPGIPPITPSTFPITVHKSIRRFNVQHNGQGELFCDHNARKCYLSAKNVMTTEAPVPQTISEEADAGAHRLWKYSTVTCRGGLGVSLSTEASVHRSN